MNLYSDPQKFGLALIAERDFAGSFAFDQVLVFRDVAGRILVAHDSGCSCPIPFESMGVDDLVEVSDWRGVREFTLRKVSQYNLSGTDLVDWVDRVRKAIEGGDAK